MHSLLTTHYFPLRHATFVLSLSLALGAYLRAAPPNYDDHILPIFENSCTNCHNPDKQKGDLDLTTYSSAMRGSSGGKFAVSGEGGDSTLYGVITHTRKPKMPPKGERLGKKETDLIRAWIDGGLLENKSGKPRKKTKPALVLAAAPSSGKPDHIAMPHHLLLEPVVATSRSTAVTDLAASPWAPLLAVIGQRQILLYHTENLELLGVLPFDYGQPETLSFHPSGKYLLAGGGIGGKSGTTVTWEITSGKQVLRAGKDYDSVLAASLRADLGGVSFGGPGKRVKLWDTATDAPLASIKKHTDWITQLAYSSDGVLLASGGRGGGIYVWEADTGNEFHNLRGHKASITGLAWRSDSNLLATASEDGTLMIWEMNNGRQVKKITAHAGGVLSLDWARNGQLVTSGRDHRVRIWKSNFSPAKALPPFSSLITAVAFSYDGKRVFAADWTGAITVWDSATAKKVGSIASNPPTIASRIISLESDLTNTSNAVAESEQSARRAVAARANVQAAWKKAEAMHKNALAQYQQLTAQRAKLDAQLKPLYAAGKVLAAQRQQQQAALTQAREALNEHNAAVSAMRKQSQQAENEVKKSAGQEIPLARREEKSRKLAQKNPGDAAAQETATQAKTALDAHRKKLALQRHTAQKKSTALALLTAQQKGPGNRLAAAAKAWKEISVKWTTHYARRKPIQEKRTALNQRIPRARTLVRSTEKPLKTARKKLTQAEKSSKKSAAALADLQQRIILTKSSIHRWRAATINTAALRLAREAAALHHDQTAAMDAFSILAAEITTLKTPEQLREKSRQLAKLRRKIDEAAPEVLAKFREASDKKADYQKALKR